jgi:predicted DCC family thiol-disulfide oxidoreductase YuxK
MITVYYDGKCGLCRREVEYYKSISHPDHIMWIDITQNHDLLKSKGFNLSEVYKTFHAVDEHGNIYKGVDAFIVIWKRLENWNWLGSFVALPFIKQIAEYGYAVFAYLRFKYHGYDKCNLN